MPTYCETCQHYVKRQPWRHDKCSSPNYLPNLVRKGRGMIRCEKARRYDDLCGERANWYKPKIAQSAISSLMHDLRPEDVPTVEEGACTEK